MVKKNIILVFLLFLSLTTVATATDVEWTKSIGNVTAVAIDEYGEHIYAGLNNGTLICYNPDGDVQWQKSLTGVISDLRTTPDGGYIAAITSSKKAYLYTVAGVQVYDKTLAYTPLSIDLSKTGIVTIASASQFWNYDETGDLIGTYASTWNRTVIDPDDEYVILTKSSDNGLYKYTINTSSGWSDDDHTVIEMAAWINRRLVEPTVAGNVSINISLRGVTGTDLILTKDETNDFESLRVTDTDFTYSDFSFNPSSETAEWYNEIWSARTAHQVVEFDDKMWVIGGTGTFYKNDTWYSSDGVTWTQATAAAEWTARYEHQVIVFDDKLWVIGGRDGVFKNDVWYSSDGITWTEATAAAGWTARHGHQTEVFNNKMWVLGGYTGSYKNDVWYSSDGVTWTEATAAAAWAARTEHQTAVFDNKMWVLGGDTGANKNDVWYSSDGVTWTEATAAAGWTARHNLQATVFDNKIYVIGGFDGTFKNDVWYSSNGVAWTETTPSVDWSARDLHQAVTFNDKLWVLGGYNGSYLNDVWSSPDGSIWTRETAAAGWSARRGHQVEVFNDKLWVIGGFDGGYKNDVWYSSDGVTWTEAIAAAGWTARHLHQSVVYDDKLWVIGGETGANKNDVWYSSNGVTWTEATAAAAWAARYQHQSVVYDDKMWVIGGYDGGYYNDVWYSSNGVTWTQATAAAAWTARYGHQSEVFDDKMWVLGGLVGGAYNNQSYYSSDGVTWTQSLPTVKWSARYQHQATVFDDKIWVLGGSDGSYRNDIWRFGSELFNLDVVNTGTDDFYIYYNNAAAGQMPNAKVESVSHITGTINAEETVTDVTITESQTSTTITGNIIAIDSPESGDWIGVSTESNIYHIAITSAGFGTSYDESSTGTPYDIATADSASMSIEGRGIIADIYQIDATKVGTYTTGGLVEHVAISDKNALWASAGGSDGKVYVFSKDESSAWYLDYASDSYEPVTDLVSSWRGEYILAGRSSGLTLYSTATDETADSDFWFTLYVFKDGKSYNYAPVNVSVFDDDWELLATGVTDSEGKYVIELTSGEQYKFNINDEKTVIFAASPSIVSQTINILTSPISTVVDYSAVYNSTTNKIEMIYDDADAKTEEVTFRIYRTDTWETVYSNTVSGVGSNDVDDEYSVLDDTTSYKVELQAERESGSLLNHFFISMGAGLSKPFEDSYLSNAIFSGFLLFLAGLFGYASSIRGTLAVSIIAAWLVYVEWMTIPWYWILIAIILCLFAGFAYRRF